MRTKIVMSMVGILLLFFMPTVMAATWFETNLLAEIRSREWYDAQCVVFSVRQSYRYDSHRPTGVYINCTNHVRIVWNQTGEYGIVSMAVFGIEKAEPIEKSKTTELIWWKFYQRGQGNATIILPDGDYVIYVWSVGESDVRVEQLINVTERIVPPINDF